MTKLIQLADDPADIKTSGLIKLVSEGKDQVPALTYLVTETGHGSYFSQVKSPKVDINLSARSEFDPSSLGGALKVLSEEYAKDAIWQTAFYYQTETLAHKQGDRVTAPMTRPGAGSAYRRATASEICEFTGLPLDGVDVAKFSHVLDANDNPVFVNINERILCHHMLVGGTTGQGKTHYLANVINAAQSAGFAVIVYDHKPDYVTIDQPNENHPSPKSAANSHFWTLGPSERADAIPIKVEACELDSRLLAETICWMQNEERMAEVLGAIIGGFRTIRLDSGKPDWNWDDFLNWYHQFDSAANIEQALPFRVKLNETQIGGISRRLLPDSRRVPSWIGRREKHTRSQWNRNKEQSPVCDFFSEITPGSVHVIRVDGEGGDSRSYGLFLDYSLRKISNHRKRGGPKIVHIIDEAADIFKSGSRSLKDQAASCLTAHIRKGRSLKIGFVIAVQSAGDVPDEIRQNLNSVVVFKHKNPSVLREVLPEQASDIFGIVNNLQPGEAIVNLFGVRGLIHANMNMSPFKLYNPEETEE